MCHFYCHFVELVSPFDSHFVELVSPFDSHFACKKNIFAEVAIFLKTNKVILFFSMHKLLILNKIMKNHALKINIHALS